MTLPLNTPSLISAAIAEMKKFVKMKQFSNIHLKGGGCGSKLEMNERGSSLVTSGFKIRFFVEQVCDNGLRTRGRGRGSVCSWILPLFSLGYYHISREDWWGRGRKGGQAIEGILGACEHDYCPIRWMESLKLLCLCTLEIHCLIPSDTTGERSRTKLPRTLSLPSHNFTCNDIGSKKRQKYSRPTLYVTGKEHNFFFMDTRAPVTFSKRLLRPMAIQT